MGSLSDPLLLVSRKLSAGPQEVRDNSNNSISVL